MPGKKIQGMGGNRLTPSPHFESTQNTLYFVQKNKIAVVFSFAKMVKNTNQDILSNLMEPKWNNMTQINQIQHKLRANTKIHLYKLEIVTTLVVVAFVWCIPV